MPAQARSKVVTQSQSQSQSQSRLPSHPTHSYSHPTRASHPDRCRCSHLLPCHRTRLKVSSQDGAFFTLCSASTWLYSTSSPRSLPHTPYNDTSPNCIVIGINSRSTVDRPSSADSSDADHRLNLPFCTLRVFDSLLELELLHFTFHPL
ncbi:hypothetical protein CDEST_06453 [Colletotrichum destructivum]|uniref:Uncharacterized protein n=1 Tax=Colletotrichum destructivum TaxID=34406 RepID=A0AAX4IDI6_9PEZI|nr:hypothetical protein CDEST_06453 [Colletotrichum destructivum]